MPEAYWLTQRESVHAFNLQPHPLSYNATSTFSLVLYPLFINLCVLLQCNNQISSILKCLGRVS